MQKQKNRVFNIYLIYFISMVIFTLLRVSVNYGLFSGIDNTYVSMITTFIIQVLIMFLIPFLLYRVLNGKGNGIKKTLNVAGFKKISGKVVLISLALGVIAFFINIAVSTVFSGLISFFGYKGGSGGSSTGGASIIAPGWALLIDLILIAVLPALCEEFLHRGILLNEMTNEGVGYRKSIVLSSLLFGLIHFNVNQFFYAFVLGLLMALIVVVSKNIWPAIILHFVNNGLSVYLSHAQANNWFGNGFYDFLAKFLQSDNFVLTMLTITMFLLFIVSLAMYLIFALFRQTTLKNVNLALEQVFKENETENATVKKEFKPTVLEKHLIINEIILKNSNLNVSMSQVKNPIDVLLPVEKGLKKQTLLTNSLLIASIVLGGLTTIFTFIWGLF